ncbi:diheme cytochrome SoxA (sulfur oxidation) [Roseinatronobacter thiooxidans]|uniref:SoxAX cytochrome complex subunit A n=1 Tax=Roseinatronobacter thiooxidans TaxID=121821 RepID=A0A2W7Q456_9RHOB|nr:sulfur oxidation c-type cytochrome SoxA [Roseinatronobacter thiooxidans]PZX38947.1 diheme cytochrome SoxA (sulfur oxidation) [Roseinatronobacter thiooxidans]
MKTMTKLWATVAICGAMLSSTAFADPHPDAELIIEGELHIATRAEPPEHLGGVLPEIYSGWLFRTDETRELQMDDFDNPGMLFAERGEDRWELAEGTANQSCADCHGDVESMAGVRAVMPKVNENGELWSMQNYINNCRTERMGADAWGWNSEPMKDVTSLISLQSRGMPVAVKIDGEAAEFWEKGREMYYTRFGQLELSCANCHEDNWGRMIRADHLSQGMSNGFPTYRLKNASIVPLHQRFRGCIRDTRGESFAEGSQEFRELELYVSSRGLGLPVEGISVRQ